MGQPPEVIDNTNECALELVQTLIKVFTEKIDGLTKEVGALTKEVGVLKGEQAHMVADMAQLKEALKEQQDVKVRLVKLEGFKAALMYAIVPIVSVLATLWVSGVIKA